MLPQGAGPHFRGEVIFGAAEAVLLVWLGGVSGLLDLGHAGPPLLAVAVVLFILWIHTQRPRGTPTAPHAR